MKKRFALKLTPLLTYLCHSGVKDQKITTNRKGKSSTCDTLSSPRNGEFCKLNDAFYSPHSCKGLKSAKLKVDLQKSLAGYREPRLLCRNEYRPFLFCKNLFIVILKQQMTCSLQSVSPVCLLKLPSGYPGNPKSNCQDNKLRLLPHSSGSIHMSKG